MRIDDGKIRVQEYEPIKCPACHTEKPWVRATKKRTRYYLCSNDACGLEFKARVTRRDEKPPTAPRPAA